MKKIVKNSILMSTIGLIGLTTNQRVSAAEQKQETAPALMSSNESIISASSQSSKEQKPSTDDSTESGVIKNSESAAETKNKEEVTVKQNNEIGPGFYDAPKVSQRSTLASMKLLRNTSRASMNLLRNTSSFISSIHDGAISSWRKYGVLPSVSGAQAILESGWGQSTLATYGNNLFGIKGTYNGQYVTMPTQEYINGQWITVNAQFRKYNSWNESIEDHGNFLAVNSRYHNLLWKTNYREVTSLLKQDGYATAPNYDTLLNSLIEQYGLTSWDREVTDNVGSLDQLTANSNNILALGWHAINDANNLPYSYLILIDTNTGKEHKRIAINRGRRDDVANAYPSINTAAMSGINANIPVDSGMYGHTYRVISRYAQLPSGEGSAKDFNFTNTVKVSAPTKQNLGSLDNVKVSSNKISMNGWHASDYAQGKNTHYLIVMNVDTNKEIKRLKVNNSLRNDVHSVYPNVYNSGMSGFSAELAVDKSLEGKNFYVISRYTSTTNGNSDYVDYQFPNVVNVPQGPSNLGSIDQLIQNGNILHISGWHISKNVQGLNNNFIIIMNKANNKEIGRVRINRITRNDVAAVYPTVDNAAQSGFDIKVSIDAKLKQKNIYLISRYSNSNSGEGRYVDYQFINSLNIK
ncbi:mannosyl-glycoprotein endo-beta-n-acetylglucosaminidase [Latilactobacillus curvatus]|uniref:glycoside hydrolase family 73 protein n=1 Tax=Latilactobacillus curvatus TaxID=28038 RepID=UPI0005755F10|nr:glycoside hydrolase family 73 protein [Latilactobacillus curvatus]AOO74923.1 hypothetical protein LCW_01985 [Latilactobacillus curvatus]KHO11835.1 mannosyl-glycoprotein endo-beta-n-acetylglucosaminidase [Latilactobacillus curvatus]WBY49240.1 glycoside hydrolase family 73 protein [Latilactobacillus curvatus]